MYADIAPDIRTVAMLQQLKTVF